MAEKVNKCIYLQKNKTDKLTLITEEEFKLLPHGTIYRSVIERLDRETIDIKDVAETDGEEVKRYITVETYEELFEKEK